MELDVPMDTPIHMVCVLEPRAKGIMVDLVEKSIHIEVPVEMRHTQALQSGHYEFEGDSMTFDLGPVLLICEGIKLPLEVLELTKDTDSGETFMGLLGNFDEHRIVGNPKYQPKKFEVAPELKQEETK